MTAESTVQIESTDDPLRPAAAGVRRRGHGPGTWRQFWLLLIAMAVIFYVVPDPSLKIAMLIYGLWAVSLNLLVGYGGLVSFGHALPFGFGAYAAGLMLTESTESTWAAWAVAAVSMGLLSTFVGAVCLRRTEVYFSMLTLAFAQLGFFIALQWRSVTGGDDGLSSIPSSTLALPWGSIRMSSIGEPDSFFFVTAVVVAVVFAALILFTDSPMGRVLEAIRESEERARGCGYNTRAIQLITFALSGAVAGLAGGMYAMLNNFVGLTPYFILSGTVLIMTILGGRGSLFGPFIGAAVYLGLEHELSQRYSSWQLIVGAIFVVCVLAFPQGLWGIVAGSGDRRGLLDLLRFRR
jgi:branched-chain amino acid transport system permease protein